MQTKKELRDIFNDVQYTVFGVHDINKQSDTTHMPDLETEKSAAQRRKQEAEGLKILTPQQMLTRLPVSLAQLGAGNNSEKI